MTVFVVQPEPSLNDRTSVMIKTIAPGAPHMPAVIVSDAQNGFPLDVKTIATNVASMLNGAPPQENLCATAEIYYERKSHEIILRHRDPQRGGISTHGLNITPLGADRDDIMTRFTPDFMAELCGAIQIASPAGPTSTRPAPPLASPPSP